MGIGPTVIPPIVKGLLIANAVVFVLQQMIGLNGFALFPALVLQGGYLWQPFTYMWLHGGLGHIAMNMFVLWMFGSQLAMVWGAKRFLRYYLLCGVGAGFLIAHGRSNARAIRNAVCRAVEFCAADLNLKIRDKIAELHSQEERLLGAG